MTGSYLKFEQIGMSFHRGNASTEVLRDVNLTIEQGEFVSLIGHSGNGVERTSWRGPELLSISQIQAVQLIGIARSDQDLSV